MKKLQNTNGNKSRIRSFLAVAGLATAIIGSLVLLQDFYPTNSSETSLISPIKISKIANADLLVNAVSTAWSLK